MVTHLDNWVHWQHLSAASAAVLSLCPLVPGSILTFTGCAMGEAIEETVPFGEKLNLVVELFARAFLSAMILRSLRTVALGFFLTGFLSSLCEGGGGGGSVGGSASGVGAVALASFDGLPFGEECFVFPLRMPRGRRGVVGRSSSVCPLCDPWVFSLVPGAAWRLWPASGPASGPVSVSVSRAIDVFRTGL